MEVVEEIVQDWASCRVLRLWSSKKSSTELAGVTLKDVRPWS